MPGEQPRSAVPIQKALDLLELELGFVLLQVSLFKLVQLLWVRSKSGRFSIAVTEASSYSAVHRANVTRKGNLSKEVKAPYKRFGSAAGLQANHLTDEIIIFILKLSFTIFYFFSLLNNSLMIKMSYF